MCGIVGIFATSPVNQSIYDALTVLQHRGQDAAGIVTEDTGRFYLRKDNGLVRDVFRTRHMRDLRGNRGIGHVRYPTAGSSSSAEAQPFYVNSPYGIVFAHNGNLTNRDELTEEIYRTDLRHVNTTSDSEVLLNVFAHEIQARKKIQPKAEDIFAAVTRLHERCKGGYAVVAMISGYGIMAFRDPLGIRPLVYGKRTNPTTGKAEYMVASESVALDAIGYKLVRDVAPGEAIYIDNDGVFHCHNSIENQKPIGCIFEHVYFARPDSLIDNCSVYKARARMGEYLAEKIIAERPDHDIDVIIPIPESSRPSAMELAHKLNIKFREGFVKNRYIGRTFIMPGQETRKKSVKQKLNPIGLEFKDKNVLLVDDSIVRGTTCQKIIELAREAGAKKVYFASASPPVRHPNVYGIDMPVRSELIAHDRTVEQIREKIGADWLIYQDLDDLIKSAIPTDEPNSDKQFECSVFTGEYITGDIDEAYLRKLEDVRNDIAKDNNGKPEDDSEDTRASIVDLHGNVGQL